MHDNDYKVYYHRNRATGKVYVGCTKKPLSQRFDNGFGYISCRRFFRDIVKYGFDGFDHVLVRDGMTREEALALEEKTIANFDSMNPERGYNMRSGGESNVPCEETCRAISKAKMGHEVSEETRAKLRTIGCKAVEQVSLEGAVVNVFPSITDAAAAVNVAKPNVWAAVVGRKPTCRGFKWRYAEERDRVKHETTEHTNDTKTTDGMKKAFVLFACFVVGSFAPGCARLSALRASSHPATAAPAPLVIGERIHTPAPGTLVEIPPLAPGAHNWFLVDDVALAEWLGIDPAKGGAK